MAMPQIIANINKLKNQIQYDFIDNLHDPSLKQNLTIALDDLINNSNSDQFAAQLLVLKQTQTNGGIQYRQFISPTNILINNLRERNNSLGLPVIINDIQYLM